ncbi:uncharacterized protein LOC133179527 [Saccostrea echinata]|uniref:uncharacterized protein LOC133179527 n=1 Tax=Saccostrea echinata TaxID=191078 RepID=UPI002A807A40|nr:uncharacterized protein LOC133179527 [Saccostrea echinata]
MSSVDMDFSGPEQENESQDSLHLELEETEIDSLECSDIDSTTITPLKKKKSRGAVRRVRVLRPLSPSDAGSESDSILNTKEKLVQSSRNKEYEPEQTPSTFGKKLRMATLRRSARKRPSDTRAILQESDKETDADTPSSLWAVYYAHWISRSWNDTKSSTIQSSFAAAGIPLQGPDDSDSDDIPLAQLNKGHVAPGFAENSMKDFENTKNDITIQEIYDEEWEKQIMRRT